MICLKWQKLCCLYIILNSDSLHDWNNVWQPSIMIQSNHHDHFSVLSVVTPFSTSTIYTWQLLYHNPVWKQQYTWVDNITINPHIKSNLGIMIHDMVMEVNHTVSLKTPMQLVRCASCICEYSQIICDIGRCDQPSEKWCLINEMFFKIIFKIIPTFLLTDKHH